MARDRKSSSIASGFYIPGKVSAEQLANRPDPPKSRGRIKISDGKHPFHYKSTIKTDAKK